MARRKKRNGKKVIKKVNKFGRGLFVILNFLIVLLATFAIADVGREIFNNVLSKYFGIIDPTTQSYILIFFAFILLILGGLGFKKALNKIIGRN